MQKIQLITALKINNVKQVTVKTRELHNKGRTNRFSKRYVFIRIKKAGNMSRPKTQA